MENIINLAKVDNGVGGKTLIYQKWIIYVFFFNPALIKTLLLRPGINCHSPPPQNLALVEISSFPKSGYALLLKGPLPTSSTNIFFLNNFFYSIK